MNIFYINREEDAERRKLIKAELQLHNLHGTHFRALGVDSLPRITTDTPIYFSSPGQRGCLSSHLALLRHIAESDDSSQHTLVLEDDCRLAPKIDLEQITKQAPADFGILQLATSNAKHIEILHNAHKRLGVHWYGWYSSLWGAHAYIIKKEAAASIAARLYPGEMIRIRGIHMPLHCTADHLIFRLCQTYTSCIPLAYQRSLPSSIHPNDETLDREEAERYCIRLWTGYDNKTPVQQAK